MTKTEKEGSDDKVTFNMKRDLIEKVLAKAQEVFPLEHIHYYTEAIRRVLITFLNTPTYKIKKGEFDS